MIAKALCAALHGVDAFKVDIEVDYSRSGLPAFNMVGLAEGAVKEAHSRVFAALKNCNYKLPSGRITINLAPANRPKAGSGYDLPMALGLLAAAGIISEEAISGYFFVGELSLTGEVQGVPGVLPIAELAAKKKAKGIIVAKKNAQEAAIVKELLVYGVDNLVEAVNFLNGTTQLQATIGKFEKETTADTFLMDFAEVKGQEHAKRAIEIAAAGGHNILFIGPPGSGKTMLAQRIPDILPPLSFSEALEVTKIYSVSNRLGNNIALIQRRPFRSPHHTTSTAGLVGGSANPKPGEISLAHRGVLFLDELAEFQKPVLEVLRQPLENGSITIARAANTVSFPAKFMLVAAMNPCPCGYAGDSKRSCTCSPLAAQRYKAKLSGPLLDRIDLHIEVPSVAYQDLREVKVGSSSAEMQSKILKARKIQEERYQDYPCHSNSELNGKLLEKFCQIDQATHDFLGQAMESLALSARGYTRILRLARTIADLDSQENIQLQHLAEAISCRVLDRKN